LSFALFARMIPLPYRCGSADTIQEKRFLCALMTK
jgi:hypothetical protein